MYGSLWQMVGSRWRASSAHKWRGYDLVMEQVSLAMVPNNDTPHPEPTIGQHVRRRDDGCVGFVRYIVKECVRRTRPEHMFMAVGDIDVFMKGTYCTSIVSHSSRFWQSWELVRCDHCDADQCQYYTKLVELGMSFALAARVAVVCHSGETLVVSPDDHIELREFQSGAQTDAELAGGSRLTIPTFDLVVDWNGHDDEPI